MGLVFSLLFAVLPGTALAQDAVIRVPEELSAFWAKWADAKKSPLDEPMDKVVRAYEEEAEQMLNLLLDDVSRDDSSSLWHEARLLAWSLDRVGHSERYISRVRFVSDLEVGDRKRRVLALGLWFDALDVEDQARKMRTDKAWGDALDAYEKCRDAFEKLGDWEYVVFCLVQSGEVQRKRGLLWEQARLLQQVVDVAGRLPFEEPALGLSQEVLATLKADGIDPEGERPADAPAAGLDDARGGFGLEAYAPGSVEQVFRFERTSGKKGISGVKLPSFFDPDQYQLWPVTWVAGQGPSDFDSQRGGFFKPEGHPWIVTRDGIETFELDRDGDGNPEVSFAGSSSPRRIEIAAGDGGAPYALMVATLGQREFMFDLEVNYESNADGARLRFFPAYWYEGKVLGEKWKLYDIDMDGSLGQPYIWSDDLITDLDPEAESWWTTDAVQIGRSKRAIPWSTVLPVDGEFYRASIDAAKGELKLHQLHLATGNVRLDAKTKVQPSMVIVHSVDELLPDAFFDVVPDRKGQTVTLPVGKYRLASGRIATGKKTSMDQVRIYVGQSKLFEVKENETTELALGAPYKLVFKPKKVDGSLRVNTSTLRIYGRGGEEYAMLFDEALLPTMEAQDAAGRKVANPKRLQQASIGEWEKDVVGNILWFPLDAGVDVPRGETYELRLTQKAHPLLGGPFESDWIR